MNLMELNEMKRPLFVTIIAWILIILSAIGLIALGFALNTHLLTQEEISKTSTLSPLVLYTSSAISIFINLVCGMGFLKGKNWSRYLYLITGLISFAINMATSEVKTMMIPSAVIFVIIVMFLFVPKNTNAFFKQNMPNT